MEVRTVQPAASGALSRVHSGPLSASGALASSGVLAHIGALAQSAAVAKGAEQENSSAFANSGCIGGGDSLPIAARCSAPLQPLGSSADATARVHVRVKHDASSAKAGDTTPGALHQQEEMQSEPQPQTVVGPRGTTGDASRSCTLELGDSAALEDFPEDSSGAMLGSGFNILYNGMYAPQARQHAGAMGAPWAAMAAVEQKVSVRRRYSTLSSALLLVFATVISTTAGLQQCSALFPSGYRSEALCMQVLLWYLVVDFCI